MPGPILTRSHRLEVPCQDPRSASVSTAFAFCSAVPSRTSATSDITVGGIAPAIDPIPGTALELDDLTRYEYEYEARM